jgi:hypothetical protein
MTKRECCDKLGVQTYDTALPQSWFEEMWSITGDSPLPHFVWCYDGNSILGYPRPLTARGLVMLTTYNLKHGSSYQTNLSVINSLGEVV